MDLSVAILSLYISPDEITQAELRALVEKSYSTFRHPDVTPLKKLDDKRFVLELFHGPTFAFKDVALQLLGNLFEFFLLRRNAKKSAGEKPEKLTVVGATSGDTGRCAVVLCILCFIRVSSNNMLYSVLPFMVSGIRPTFRYSSFIPRDASPPSKRRK